MRYRFLSLSLLLLVPLSVSAADEFTSLLRELENLEAELEADVADQENVNEDNNYETLPDLFPRTETDGEGSRREDSVSDTHVYTRVNGIPYVLEDVPLAEWFAPYVREIADRGIISGYTDASGRPLGKFGPADNVTLAQVAKIVVSASLVDMTKCPAEPVNLSGSGTWAAPYAACAEYLAWSVFKDPTVDLNRAATRTELVVTVLEAFGREFEVGTGQRFRDVSATFPMAGAIESAALDGLVSGYTGQDGNETGFFGPFDNVNRAETAKIVALAVQQYAD